MKNKNTRGKGRLLYLILALVLIAGFISIRNSSDSGKEITDGLLSTGAELLAGQEAGPASGETAPAEPPASEEEDTGEVPSAPAEEDVGSSAEQEVSFEDSAATAREEQTEAPVKETEAPGEVTAEEESEKAVTLDEDGVYDSMEDVALYLQLYHKLPSNYITKKEAKAQGWSGNGSDKLDKYCPGKCIGGDYFGNYEGVLPKGKYHECDIGTLGAKSRGTKRIVYSSDWHIYYTEDHYESFTLLYEP